MTCKEVRTCFGDPLLVDIDPSSNHASVAEHMASCTECSRFVELQRELGRSLRLVRDSIPEIPAELDRSVLASFHRYSAERVNSVHSLPIHDDRVRLLSRWGGAAAVAVLVLVAMFFSSRERYVASPALRTAQRAVVPQASNTDRSSPIPAARNQKASRALAPRARRKPAQAATAPDPPLTAGFDSLMYCDELSCGGAMEMIRMRLPESVAQLTLNSAPTNGAVLVDVLVGPDGIARGIRVVE